jgi:hypothetical protein
MPRHKKKRPIRIAPVQPGKPSTTPGEWRELLDKKLTVSERLATLPAPQIKLTGDADIEAYLEKNER